MLRMIVLLVVGLSLRPEEIGFLDTMEMAFVNSISMAGLAVGRQGIIHSIFSRRDKHLIMVTWMPMPVRQVIMCLVCGHGWTVKCMWPVILNLTTHTQPPAKSALVGMIMTRSVVLERSENLFFTRVCSPIPTVKRLRVISVRNGEFTWMRVTHTPTLILTWTQVFPRLPRIVSEVPQVHPLSTLWRPPALPPGLGLAVHPAG